MWHKHFVNHFQYSTRNHALLITLTNQNCIAEEVKSRMRMPVTTRSFVIKKYNDVDMQI